MGAAVQASGGGLPNYSRATAVCAGVPVTGRVSCQIGIRRYQRSRQPNKDPGANPRKGEIARRVELYNSAYKLAWEQIPPDQKRARPDITLRIHASIRRELKEGARDPNGIALAALKDALLPDTH